MEQNKLTFQDQTVRAPWEDQDETDRETDRHKIVHEAIGKRSKHIGIRILIAAGASAYLAFSVPAIALMVANLVDSTKLGEPGSFTDGQSIEQIIERASQWTKQLRDSELGMGEVIDFTAISTALVLAVSLRSRNAQDGTVDEESRFIWLRRITIIFCFVIATLSWGLAATRDWTTPEGCTEGLLMMLFAFIGCGLNAVVGDTVYSLSRAQRQIRLRKNTLISSRENISNKAKNSITTNRLSMLAWWTHGTLLPVLTTLVTALWGIEKRQGNLWGLVIPIACIAAWCFYVWLYRSKMFDLTEGKRRYIPLHIFIGLMLVLQGFVTLSLATWSLSASITVICLTYLLPWLILIYLDKRFPLFINSRRNTIKKEIDRLDDEIQKLQQSIEAHKLSYQNI